MNSTSFPLRFHVQQVKSEINRQKITMRLDLPSVTWEHWHFIFLLVQSDRKIISKFCVSFHTHRRSSVIVMKLELANWRIQSRSIFQSLNECVCKCAFVHVCVCHEDEQGDEWRWAYCELICLNRVLTPESICPQLHRRIRVNREEIRMHVFISSLTSSSYCPTFWLPAADTNPNFMKSSKSATVLNLRG